MSRATNPVDARLLEKLSRLYYEQGLTEQAIGDRLQLSRSKVSRLLKQARAEGVVQIRVVSPAGTFTELEAAIESRYNLSEAVIVNSVEPLETSAIVRDIGLGAARYLLRTIRDGDVVGVSWGKALRSFVDALSPHPVDGARVVQLVGGLGPPAADTHATDICRRLAGVLGADLTILPTPGAMRTVASRDALLTDLKVREALAAIDTVNLAFVGIGAPTPDSVAMTDESIVDGDGRRELLDKGAVGDIALRFFDSDGRPVITGLESRLIGVTLEQLGAIGRVVGVAGGPDKTAAIRGALLGGYLDVLITDRATAMGLLERPSTTREIGSVDFEPRDGTTHGDEATSA